MKHRIIVLAAMFVPLFCMAQSGWKAVEEDATVATKAPKEEKVKVSREESDAPYLAGKVPEVDGIVTFTHEYDMPGKSAQELYDIAYQTATQLSKEENQIQSRITLVNKDEHSFAARFTEWMTFSTHLLAVDRTEFRYSMVVICEDGHVTIGLNHISYIYMHGKVYKAEDWRNINPDEGMVYKAEDWITDREAINKKGTKLVRTSRKFRINTIDRANEIFERFGEAFNTEK